jgi:hypothetical protein
VVHILLLEPAMGKFRLVIVCICVEILIHVLVVLISIWFMDIEMLYDCKNKCKKG